jgi:integrase
MEYLTKSELRRLFAVAYERNRTHHLALVVGLWHGLRVSEIISIRGTHVVDGQLSVKRLKKSEATLQPIHVDSDPLFDESPLIEMAAQNKGRLFDFSRQRMDQFVKVYGALAGIHPEKRHTHAICKHSVAMLIWSATNSLGMIQSYLGHRAAASTLAYLREADAMKAQSVVSAMTI